MAQQSGPVRMRVTPVFEGYSADRAPVPYRVVLENAGPGAEGVLTVSADGTTTRIPVDLPSGSRKALTVYPSRIDSFEPVRIALTLPGRRLVRNIAEGVFGTVGPAVAVLTDAPGEASFLRAGTTTVPGSTPPIAGAPVSALRDVYAPPEFAPDRPLGYTGFAAVILSEGSERLTDAQVAALRQYALSGGTLVFLGGASAPVLADSRWAELLPISSPRLRERALPSIGLAAPLPRLAYVEGSLREGADRPLSNSPIAVQRPYGAGKAVLLAANPFEAPLRDYAARRSLVSRAIGLYEAGYARAWLDANARVHQETAAFLGPSFGGPVPTNVPDNPFMLELPRFSTVLGLLLAYLVLVVPINFLILRRLGRLELAWFTAPLISLAFAGVFFTFARDLYSANLSESTFGTVITEGNGTAGVFVGSTQLFLPRAGSVDLGLREVDQLSFRRALDDYGRARTGEGSIVDTGVVTVPNLATPALAFRQIFYTQRVASIPLVEARATFRGDKVRVEAVNRTGQTLPMVEIHYAGATAFNGNMEPGARRTVEIAAPKGNPQTPLGRLIARRNQIALQYAVPVPEVGPTLPAQDVGMPPVVVRFIPIGGQP